MGLRPAYAIRPQKSIPRRELWIVRAPGALPREDFRSSQCRRTFPMTFAERTSKIRL